MKNNTNQWSREAWDDTSSSKAYNADWWNTLKFGEHPVWSELHEIYREEVGLETIPPWAEEIVRRTMEIPACGYYAMPDMILQRCKAIREEQCPDVVMSCYAVDPGRKRLLAYYTYCLDGWLKGVPLEIAQAELAMRPPLGKDWGAIVSNIYRVLGEKNEPKAILVERLIHRLRWWMKTLVWSGDKRNQFCLDMYLGDPRGDAGWGCYGNEPFLDPYFAEFRAPEVQTIEGKILQIAPDWKRIDWKRILGNIHSTWLCAPKVFRYLEKIIHDIGCIGSDNDAPTAYPGILQCEDTYPDFEFCSMWFKDFISRLDQWLAGNTEAMHELGPSTPVRHWLAHLWRHRLLFESGQDENGFHRMVGFRPAGRSGSMQRLAGNIKKDGME